MPAWLLCVFCFLFFPSKLPALEDCFASFANLSGEDVEVLALSTYRNLFETLGAGRVSPETFQKMIEAENPFELPEQAGTDLQVLARRLKDFERLLENSRGDATVIREQIRAELKKMETAAVRAADRHDSALGILGTADQTFAFPPNSGRPTFNRDGTWGATNQGNSLHLFDMASKKSSVESIPGDIPTESVRFSPDGSAMFFSSANDAYVHFVPFADGKLDWANKKGFMQSGINGTIQWAQATGSPNQILFSCDRTAVAHLLDTRENVAKPVNLDAFVQGLPRPRLRASRGKIRNKVRRFGAVPNSATLYLITDLYAFHLLKVDREGGLHPEGPSRGLPIDSDSVAVSANQQFIVTTTSNKSAVRVHTVQGSDSLPLGSAVGIPWSKREGEIKLIPHPLLNEMFVISRLGDETLVESFDLATRKSVLAFPIRVPYTDKSLPELSADGGKLFLRQDDGTISIVNLAHRRNGA